jgi:DNA-binding PadR family transcriptional regulator
MAKMELGKRQVRVLSWIAKNPNSHAKAIQEGIEYPQYGNINTDVKKLKKYGFLVSKEEPSSEKRKRIVAKYRCTEKGIFYALRYIDDKDIIKTLKVNREYKSIDHFYSESERMGDTDFLYWFKDLLTFTPMLGKFDAGEIIGSMILFYSEKLEKLNEDKRIEILENAVKQLPNAKEAVTKIHHMLDKLEERSDTK